MTYVLKVSEILKLVYIVVNIQENGKKSHSAGEKNLTGSQETIIVEGFLILMAKLFGLENKNTPYTFLNLRHIYMTLG